jgi:uncharacterized membrane protein
MKKTAPTVPNVVAKNIAQLVRAQRRKNRRLGVIFRSLDKLTQFSGSTTFLVLHLIWFIIWVVLNTESAHAFDPYPYGFLTLIVSLEAIVLSIMVLMVQNKIQKDADRRAEMDVHVNLLSESEITMILHKLVRLEKKMGIEVSPQEQKQVDDLLKDTSAIEIERIIEESLEKRAKY